MNFREITYLLPVLAEDHVFCEGQKVVCYLGFGTKFVFGYNLYKTRPLQKKYGRKPGCIYLHAEIWKSVLYICRLSLGDLTFAKPCKVV